MAFFVFLGVKPAAAADTAQRPYRLDDRLEEEVIGDVIFSPDGRAIAFKRERAGKTFPPGARTSLSVPAMFLSDIWLQDSPGRQPRNLTNGHLDGTGWWGPQWSPDGQRLAFLSTRGGRVTVWVWERATDRVRQLSTQPVAVDNQYTDVAFRWAGPHVLMCYGLPEDAEPELSLHSVLRLQGQMVALATKAWAKAAAGESTASVLDSLEFKQLSRRLFVLDANTGSTRTIAAISGDEPGIQQFPSWWLSPTGQAVAFVRPGGIHYNVPSLRRMGVPRTIDLRLQDGRSPRLDRQLPDNVLTRTLQWSPDGQELAFFAYGDAPINLAVLYGRIAAGVMPDYVASVSLENPARLWRVSLARGSVEQIETGDIALGYLDAPRFFWAASGELIFHAPRRRYGATTPSNVSWDLQKPAGPTDPLEWWVLARDGRTRTLTTDVKALSHTIQAVNGGATLLNVTEGEVWRIDPAKGVTKNLTARFAPFVTSMHGIEQTENHVSEILVSARPGSVDEPATDYLLNIDSGAAASVMRPVRHASAVVGYAAASRSVVYTVDDRNGTFFWRCSPTEAPELVLETNLYRRGLAKSETRKFEFTTFHGQSLKGLLRLPVGYQQGRRYPLIVIPYLTGRASELSPKAFIDSPLAAGYASLVLDMPGTPPGLAGEEYGAPVMLTSSVLPAVEKVIGMGLVDPDRLFLLGHSLGAWSVVSLITQTNRFKAAAASAGPYVEMQLNLSLSHNILDRYGNRTHSAAQPASNLPRMFPTDNPWWRERARAFQNDPLNYVERIQTPLLLHHGDLDSVSIDHAEQFFNALVSMRKRARFVRYWGEGHNLWNHANIRDFWQHTFAWFDDFGDISRDASGQMIFEGDRVRSRKGAAALTSADFARFGPTAPAPAISSGSR